MQPSTTAAAPVSVVAKLERYFEFAALATNWRTEILAGFTTFITMAYIVVVNPSIMAAAGMPIAGAAAATCLAAGFGSILMGLFSNYPLALAPGMGLNAYFTYTVVKGLGVPWETALGCVFLSGLAFLVLTLAGVRQLIVGAIPRSLFSAVAGGIGLFIAFIGLKDAGVIVSAPATTVALGDLTAPTAALALLGLGVIAALQAWRVKGAILIGILAVAALAWALGLVHAAPGAYSLPDLSATFFKLDVPAALNLKGGLGVALVEIVFVFLFVDMFDNVGTLVAVTSKAGLVEADGTIPRLNRILLSDSIATMVGALMMSGLADVDWADPMTAVPAFLTVVMTPLTYSIANGLGFGITSYALLKLVLGRARPGDWLLFSLAALFILRFVYLAKG